MYTYGCLLSDIKAFSAEGLATGSIGRTALGFDIPYVAVGDFSRGKNILIQGAIHAREHITAELIIELIRYYAHEELSGGLIFLPMVNIDGVRLVEEGLDFIRYGERRRFLLELNGERENDFTLWKANINGVDLNTNFPARWGTGEQNVTSPAPANFIGDRPLSEPESRALAQFTLMVRPAATLSYHIRGEEIYWDFFQDEAAARRDRAIAEKLAAATGYKIVEGLPSAGGYKDFCIQHPAIPAFTLEAGKEYLPFPFPYTELPKIFEQNRNVPRILQDSL